MLIYNNSHNAKTIYICKKILNPILLEITLLYTLNEFVLTLSTS